MEKKRQSNTKKYKQDNLRKNMQKKLDHVDPVFSIGCKAQARAWLHRASQNSVIPKQIPRVNLIFHIGQIR